MAYKRSLVQPVNESGTGQTSFTANAPIVAGATSTAALSQVTTGLNTAGYVLTANASGAPTFQASGGGGGGGVIYTTYSSGSGTHTLSASTKYVTVHAFSSGGGGGSGRRGTDHASTGGGGGGGGSYVNLEAPVSFFGGAGSSVSYSVGTGGAGGAAQTVDDSDGNSGSVGQATSFGFVIAYFSAFNTLGAQGGNNSYANGGASPNISFSNAASAGSSIGGGGNADLSNAFQWGSQDVSHYQLTSSGGGAGGFGSLSLTNIGGTAGGKILDPSIFSYAINPTLGGASIGANGDNGATITTQLFGGGTGGGGGANGTDVITGGNGGDGGFPGGGGGGGGGSVDGANSGTGGNGANGVLYILEYQ